MQMDMKPYFTERTDSHLNIKVSKYNAEGYYSPTEYEGMTNVLREQAIQERERKKIQNRYKEGMPLVFICSPYRGDIKANTHNARKYCRFAFSQGYNPFAPHLFYTRFLDEDNEFEREMGIKMGKAILAKCKEVWWFGDEPTEGMKSELETAKTFNKNVRHFNINLEEVKD